MSLRDQIACLEALAAVDAELRRLDEQLAQGRGTLASLRAELQKLEDKVSAARVSVAEMEKTKAELSSELRQMTAQVERSRDKLSRSRNERETNAAQRELEELRKLQRDREEESAKLTALLDAAKKSIDETLAQRTGISDDLAGRESELSGSMADAVQEHAAKTGERVRLAAGIQPATLRRYEQVRKRKGNAIAKTTDGTCLACHMRLPPMLFQKLMRGEALDQCPSCARILYYEAASDTQRGAS